MNSSNIIQYSISSILSLATSYFFSLTTLGLSAALYIILSIVFYDKIFVLLPVAIPFAILALFFGSLAAIFYYAFFISYYNPVKFLTKFKIENRNETSNQWIRTNGLLGEKTIEGNMTGEIIGFTGFKIKTKDIIHFQGFALFVNLSANCFRESAYFR